MKKFHTILCLFGIDLLKILHSFIFIPKYILHFFYFSLKNRKNQFGPIRFLPALSDAKVASGAINSIYFLQDQFVARRLYEEKVIKHFDIGSRIDGFILALSCFSDVTIYDIRDLQSTVKNIKFERRDLMGNEMSLPSVTSLSCLHTLEHFGLGRYGDPLDHEGWIKGLSSLNTMLEIGGKLYLSVPIGRQRIEFNAHRVFDPVYFEQQLELTGFRVIERIFIDDNRRIEIDVKNIDSEFWKDQSYGCGIWILTK